MVFPEGGLTDAAAEALKLEGKVNKVNTKVGKSYFHTLCTLEDVDHLITDAPEIHK